jgi:hypothetical protein
MDITKTEFFHHFRGLPGLWFHYDSCFKFFFEIVTGLHPSKCCLNFKDLISITRVGVWNDQETKFKRDLLKLTRKRGNSLLIFWTEGV